MLTPPTRIKHDVSFNDNTHPTPRRFSLSIKWWISKTFVGFQEFLNKVVDLRGIYHLIQTNAELPPLLSCERGRVGMKKSDNLGPRTGKSRTTIKEPKLLRSHQPNSQQEA
ncbi:hypothetical protein DY000_02042987 [Brassica cretica]|uniref:Uncharacterized protein n=1 Tax=Brassica cretica TaxID=69181 RepID=A0ABQ7B500_BRACR|nr:hypothetical protein DY000_02042987 [Brassica cretica]